MVNLLALSSKQQTNRKKKRSAPLPRRLHHPTFPSFGKMLGLVASSGTDAAGLQPPLYVYIRTQGRTTEQDRLPSIGAWYGPVMEFNSSPALSLRSFLISISSLTRSSVCLLALTLFPLLALALSLSFYLSLSLFSPFCATSRRSFSNQASSHTNHARQLFPLQLHCIDTGSIRFSPSSIPGIAKRYLQW